jgi:hypothetical protein
MRIVETNRAGISAKYVLQKDIEIPGVGPLGSRSPCYPFTLMMKGESVFIPAETREAQQKLRLAAFSVARNRKGWRFVTRAISEGGVNGLRIWRAS